MKQYNPKWNAPEELEKVPSSSAKKEKRASNKNFRRTGKNLLKFDLESIYVEPYRQRHHWQN